jgi:circadian clock protein KaiC
VTDVAAKLKRVMLDAEEAVLHVRAKALQTELTAKQTEKALLERTTDIRKAERTRGQERMGELRGTDSPIRRRKTSRP